MKYGKIFLIIASGTMMLGQGARMIYEGIKADSWYRPNTFDIFFDWSTLALAGLLLFFWGFYLFFTKYDKDHNVDWTITCPVCEYSYIDNITHKETTCPNCRTTGEIDLTGFDLEYAKKITHPNYHSS